MSNLNQFKALAARDGNISGSAGQATGVKTPEDTEVYDEDFITNLQLDSPAPLAPPLPHLEPPETGVTPEAEQPTAPEIVTELDEEDLITNLQPNSPLAPPKPQPLPPVTGPSLTTAGSSDPPEYEGEQAADTPLQAYEVTSNTLPEAASTPPEVSIASFRVRQRIKQFKAELRLAQQKHTEACIILIQQGAAIQELIAQIGEKESQIADLEDILQDSTATFNDQRRSIQDFICEVAQLKGKKQDLERNLSQYRTKLSRLLYLSESQSAEIKELRTELGCKTEYISLLEDKVDNLKGQLTDLNREYTAQTSALKRSRLNFRLLLGIVLATTVVGGTYFALRPHLQSPTESASASSNDLVGQQILVQSNMRFFDTEGNPVSKRDLNLEVNRSNVSIVSYDAKRGLYKIFINGNSYHFKFDTK